MFGSLLAVSTYVGAFTPEPISFGVFRFIMGVASRGCTIVVSVHCKTLAIRIILLVKQETPDMPRAQLKLQDDALPSNFQTLTHVDNLMIFTSEPKAQPLYIHSY